MSLELRLDTLLRALAGRFGCRLFPAVTTPPTRASMAELSELLLARELLVEREVQPEDVNPWLSEQPKIWTFGKLSYRLVHLIHGNASRLGHSRRLDFGIRRTDVRIQAR